MHKCVHTHKTIVCVGMYASLYSSLKHMGMLCIRIFLCGRRHVFVFMYERMRLVVLVSETSYRHICEGFGLVRHSAAAPRTLSAS